MSPIELEGVTLGQKHQYYNTLLKTAMMDKTLELKTIHYDDSDIDNFLKIDVACGRRDVTFVLEVFKSRDLLYVKRALRRSSWLFSDDQYAHIVNPYYLLKELFPKMIPKARNKLLLAIRLNLRNETRIDEFYNFLKENFEIAQKWLPYCSETLIVAVLKQKAKSISVSVIRRLCKKSLSALKVCCEINPSSDWLICGKNFLYTDTKEYLEIVDSVEEIHIPKFGKKSTHVIMKISPQIFHDHFYKYCHKIDLYEFAKHLNAAEILDFLMKQIRSGTIRSWCKYKNYKNIQPFMSSMSQEARLKFIQERSLDKISDELLLNENDEEENYLELYYWYRYVSFETAFSEMKDILLDQKTEKKSEGADGDDDEYDVMTSLEPLFGFPEPSVRMWAVEILVRSAGDNLRHIQTLLRHCRDHNAKTYYSAALSSILLRITKIHKYDEMTWNMLNDIFYDMGIYSDGGVAIDSEYIRTIVLYNVLHDKCVPKVIEEKISLNSFITLPQKLNPDEKIKVFEYLYKHASKQLVNKEVKTESDIITAVSNCDEMLRFLKAWNKTVLEFPVVTNKFEELIKLKKNVLWKNTNSRVCDKLVGFYKEHKCKNFMQEVFVLCLCDDMCLNALKHDPSLLYRYQNEIELAICEGAVSLRRSLQKLRIYWANSLAKLWADSFQTRLLQPSGQHAFMEALFILLPRKECLSLIHDNVPVVTDINWKKENNNVAVNLKKNIARYMHLLRPQVSLDTVLTYAKGDYFGFTVSILEHLLLSNSNNEVSLFLKSQLKMSGAPQKFGIRYALTHLRDNERKKLVLLVWNDISTRHSVKHGLFKHLYKLLIKEKKDKMITRIWDLMSELFDNLTDEFYVTIQSKLPNITKIPKIVRHKFYRKCFTYLKVDRKIMDKSLLSWFWSFLRYNADIIEVCFMEEELLESIDQCLYKNDDDDGYFYYYGRIEILRVFTTYLTYNISDESQQIKFDKLFVPVISRFFMVWQDNKRLFKKVLESLSLNVSKRLLNQTEHVVPAYLFKNIQKILTDKFSIENEYNIITFWNITVLFVDLLEKFSKSDTFMSLRSSCKPKYYYWYQYKRPEFEEIYSHIAPAFGEACLEYFKQDRLISAYPSLFWLASQSMMDAFISLSFPYSCINKTLKQMLYGADATAITTHYYIVIGVIRCMYLNSGNGEYKFIFDEDLEKKILSQPSKDIRTFYHHYDLRCMYGYRENDNSDWRRAGLMPTSGPNDSSLY